MKKKKINESARYVVDANVCKNDRCDNLAIRQAPEYTFPSYHLGFPALYCAKCGSNALLLNNHDINILFHSNIHLYLTEIKKYCPACYNPNSIHYGYTLQKTPRFKCKKCGSVYSYPKFTRNHKNRLALFSKALFNLNDFKQITEQLNISYSHFYILLEQLAYLCKKNRLHFESDLLKKETYHIATHSNTFIARGKPYPIELWGLTSSLSDSGYILLSQLNITDQNVSPSSLYDSQLPVILNQFHLPSILAVESKYEHFLQRSSFDQLSYHTCTFINKNKEKMITPVVLAYAHFYELEQYYHAKQIYHYLEHEVLLRGSAITSFGQSVRNKTCHILYLYESLCDVQKPISTVNKHIIGWWKNEWVELKDATDQTQRLLGLLTQGKKRLHESQVVALPATFTGIRAFHQQFDYYFPAGRRLKLSPNTLQLLLTIFTSFYNFCLPDCNGKTPAQNIGLSDKSLTFEEFISSNNNLV